MGQNCSFQLLAPAQSQFTARFARTKKNEQLYDQHLSSMQKLRGQVYLKDQAIKDWELDEEGRFHMHGDEQSWHLLLLDESKEVIGCAKYLVHPSTVSYPMLHVSQSTVAKHSVWGGKVRAAVEADLRRCRDNNLAYVEVGGWALAEEWRNTRAALEILVGSFALAQIWGGCLGSCTATVRHSSSSILRRIGGTNYEWDGNPIPSYFDAEYGCDMELLHFDYRSPSPRFLPLIKQLETSLVKATVVSTGVDSVLPKFAADFIPEPGKFLHLASAFGA